MERRVRKSRTEPVLEVKEPPRAARSSRWLETSVVAAVVVLLAVAVYWANRFLQSKTEVIEQESVANDTPQPATSPKKARSGRISAQVPDFQRKNFRFLDRDSSGRLSFAELVPAWPQTPLPELEAVLQSLDQDGSGDVDLEEFAGLAQSSSRPPSRLPRPTLVDRSQKSGNPDEEQVSELEVVPKADSQHLHGRLGRFANGTRLRPSLAMPKDGLSQEERRDAHRGFCFNSRKSEAVSLDRAAPDLRTEPCRRKHASYPQDSLNQPGASVVVAPRFCESASGWF
ncbi:unnamed protein product [Effrenium voratum]|nr:unnamed protein product [Effrenium voratum]